MRLVFLCVLFASSVPVGLAAPRSHEPAPVLDDQDELIKSFEEDLLRGELGGDFCGDIESEFSNLLENWSALALVYRYRLLKGLWSEGEGEIDGTDMGTLLNESLDELMARVEAAAQGDREAMLLVASHHEFRGRYEKATDVYAGLLATKPKDPLALCGLARMRWTTGRRKEAETIARSALDAMNGLEATADVYWLAGQLYLAIDRIEEANRNIVHAEKAWKDEGDPRQAWTLVALGDLYRRGRLEGDAIEGIKVYREALELNSWVRGAHTGLAKTYLYREESEKAKREIRMALAKLPMDPEALSLRALTLNRDGRFGEAREAVAKALEVNSAFKPALSQLAASHYLSGENEAYEKIVAQVLAIDPKYGRLWSDLGDAIAAHYRFAEAIPYYEKALTIDERAHRARIGLGQCYAHTGRNQEALDILDEARRVDPFPYPWRDNMRKVLKSYIQFPQVERDPFVYRIHAEDEPVLLDFLDERLQKDYRELVEIYGLEPEKPISIEVYRHHNDFSVRTIGFSGLGALGVCFGSVVTLVSPSSELRGGFVWARTARHELAHVFSLAASKLRVPRWLTEGLSVFEETRHHGHWDREMDLELFTAYHNGEVIPIRNLNAAFRTSRIIFGYYQGGLICKYLDETYGFEVIREMLRLFAEDKETVDVIPMVLKISPEEFDQVFLDWLWETRLKHIRVFPIYSPATKDRLRAEYSRDRNNVELCEKLAWAYSRLNRFVDMDNYLGKCLELDPDRGGVLFLQGERAFRLGNQDEALEFYQKGIEAGADDMFVRMKMADLYTARGQLEEMVVALNAAKACFPRYVGEGNVYVRLAAYYQAQGENEKALEEMRELASIDETAMIPRWQLARDAEAKQDWDLALSTLSEINDIDPFQSALHAALARAYKALGRHADAIRSLKVAMAVDPTMEPGYDPRRSNPDAIQAAKAELLVELARVYFEVGEHDSARKAAEDALEIDPENADAPGLLKEIQEHLDKRVRAPYP